MADRTWAGVERGRWRPIATVLMSLIVLMAWAGAAKALNSTVRNWPNSPVRHTLRQHVRGPVPSFSANLRGGVAIAGNTVETCPANSRASRHRPRLETCVNANNNDLNMVYVNVDRGIGRFNSSTATVTVPAGARVVRAYLYWAADLSRGVKRPLINTAADDAPGGASPSTNPLYTTVKLRAGASAYSTIDATATGRNGRWDYIASWYQQPGQDPGWAYQVRADVTAEISAGLATRARRTRAGNAALPVTVANVQAGTGYNRYAGWNLVVVWEKPTAAWRDITLFDGFDFVQVQGGQQLVVGPLNFTGFQTPASGNVDAHATVWATEGDRAITGDYLSLGGLSSSCTGLKPQSDSAHPATNFFNSTISDAGAPVSGRTPGYDNQLGFDLATLAVREGTIPNGATGASVCLGTTGDTYFFGGIAFDTLIRAPNLAISKAADHASASPGDLVTYTTTVTNPSTRDPGDPLLGTPVAAATNLVVTDKLPSGLRFVAFTANGNACTYTPASRTISCTLARLAPDETFRYAYQARVEAVAQGSTAASLVNSACYDANSEDQPNVTYTGCDDASVRVPPAPPPLPADLGIVKTVSDNVVAPGATLTWKLVGTNYGPAIATGFVLADELPPGVAFVSASATAPLTCTTPPVGGTGAVVCMAATVPPTPASGSSLTLTITATVPSTTANKTLLTNVGTVSADQAEPTPDPHPNRDQTETLVVVPPTPVPPNPIPPNPLFPPPTPAPLPDPTGPPQLPTEVVHGPRAPIGAAGTRLSIHKTGSPASVSLGATINYTLRVSNIGDASALHVRVCDTPPAGLTVALAPGFRRTSAGVCTTVSTLRSGATRTFHLSATATSAAGGRTVNRATVSASNAPTGHISTATRVRIPPPPGLG